MSFYIGRESSKLWKRICAETTTELNLLAENWKYLLAGLVFQYIHGLAARGVHYIHRPGPTLQDVGFMLLPELGKDKAYISETLFSFIFISFFLWTFHPFIFKSKKIYTVLLWCRVLAFLVGSKLATLPPPNSVLEVLLINFPHGVIYGCGDLIFSSHMIFTLVFVRTYQKYGTRRWIKQLAWLLAIILSFLIVASRKHYTVDVVVACKWKAKYRMKIMSIFPPCVSLPNVWFFNLYEFLQGRPLSSSRTEYCMFPVELPDRSNGIGSLLLPVTTKEKDGRTKEENHKLLNGNSGDPADRRQRTQVNGKILEDGNTVHADGAMNGS
ncbi:hypothetical protein TIFTF001_016963 [Ficus carica]|uniref:Sphingomyelin synthase-like domain-containing protein n=1 Tax=Ficus carica TaxID=3494 RepID=A0AA88APT3_FICCA|nr:hypothetical protein TIFTF001_016963 [Ficus carica]